MTGLLRAGTWPQHGLSQGQREQRRASSCSGARAERGSCAGRRQRCCGTGTFPARLQASSSARCPGGFPHRAVLQHRSPSAGHPPALTRTGRLRQGSGHGAGRRAELLPLLSPAAGLSLQPSLLSSFIRCQLVTCVRRETGNRGLHPGLCQQPRKGNRGHFEGSCASLC